MPSSRTPPLASAAAKPADAKPSKRGPQPSNRGQPRAKQLPSKKPAANTKAGTGCGTEDLLVIQNDGSDGIVMRLYYELQPHDVWLDEMQDENRDTSGMMVGVNECALRRSSLGAVLLQLVLLAGAQARDGERNQRRVLQLCQVQGLRGPCVDSQ